MTTILTMPRRIDVNSSGERKLTDPSQTGSWLERIGRLWCRFLHDAAMWPIHGTYECRVCHRRYGVEWASQGTLMPKPKPRGRLVEIAAPSAGRRVAVAVESFPGLSVDVQEMQEASVSCA